MQTSCRFSRSLAWKCFRLLHSSYSRCLFSCGKEKKSDAVTSHWRIKAVLHHLLCSQSYAEGFILLETGAWVESSDAQRRSCVCGDPHQYCVQQLFAIWIAGQGKAQCKRKNFILLNVFMRLTNFKRLTVKWILLEKNESNIFRLAGGERRRGLITRGESGITAVKYQ